MSKGKYVAYISSYTQGDSHGIRIYDGYEKRPF